MLEPVDGMDRLVSLLDEVTCDKPTLPALVVVATSTDPTVNSQFLADLKVRLSGSDGNVLVPHAHADKDLIESAATSGLTSYAALLDLLVQKLRGRIPRGAGGGTGKPGDSNWSRTSSMPTERSARHAGLRREPGSSPCCTSVGRAAIPSSVGLVG